MSVKKKWKEVIRLKKEILIIGSGGQGALTIGEIILRAVSKKNYAVSFYPFYGSQMRGGSSSCVVKIDTENDFIINPTMNIATDIIVLDERYIDNYKDNMNEETVIYKNEFLNDKNANLKMLKKYINDNNFIDDEDIIFCLREKFKNDVVFKEKIEAYRGV